MSSRQPLTLKYRPQTFAQLLIQDHVRNTLTQAIERDRLANAYLFAGPRGVGKTTTARILAKCLNCLSFAHPTVTPCNNCSACVEISESRSIDVMEIDGASERRIDDVRELREGIRYSPCTLRYKVYIIDEVHMLTREAFNAILKTLEEPPRHAKFIFATTEAHKLPLTIVSRCQRFDFRKATIPEICARLNWIAERENIRITREAVAAIAARADGAVRDAESMLEQLAMYSPTGTELSDVEELFGLVPTRFCSEYTELLLVGDAAGIVRQIDSLLERGQDPIEFFAGLINHFRQLLRLLYADTLPGAIEEDIKQMEKQAQGFGHESLLRVLNHLANNELAIKQTAFPHALLEVISLELIEKTRCKRTRPEREEGVLHQTKPIDQPPGPENSRNASSGLPDVVTLWQKLRTRLDEQKPILACLLDICTPVSFSNGVLSVRIPSRQSVAAKQLEANIDQIENILSSIVKQNARVQLAVAEHVSAGHSTVERISRVFGSVEEERNR